MNMRPLHSLLLATALSMPAFAQKPTDAQRLATACNRFAADLHAQLALGGAPTCSPASVAIALLMLLPAAKGDTANELATVLHLPEDLRGTAMHDAARDLLQQVGLMQTGSPNRNQPPSPLVITNDIWVQKDFTLVPAYVDLLRRSFAAAQQHADFRADAEAARKVINDHIAKATHGRIRELLSPGLITSLTRVVLTNALWFKAAWEHPFTKSNTQERPFTLADGEVVQTPTMEQVEMFGYAETADWQVVSLPFATGTIECEIVLPRAGQPITTAQHALLTHTYRDTLAGERVQIELPRFTVQASHRLRDALIALGMPSAFDAQRADFSGMDPHNDLIVDDVVHQTWIAIDEEGAEAAAATAVVLKVRSIPEEFRADHPFAFGLRDRNTGLLLFVGRVDDPRPHQD